MANMKITDVSAIQLSLRLSRPQRNSRGSRLERRFTLVTVETDSGITGLGDAFGDQNLVVPIIERRVGPLAIGLDPMDVSALWNHLCCSRAFWEIGGSYHCAVSAVEVACWDIRGKAEGVPVCELLGGRIRDSVEAYASDLHWDEPDRMAETAASYVERGFRFVKTHIGHPNEAESDLARLAAIRSAVGRDVGLMIDINTAFDRPTALEQGRAFQSFNPYWYEEPLSPLDIEGHAMLRQELQMDIATGENLYSTHGFEPLLSAHGCDIVMPDILRCGGLDQTLKICGLARKAGIVVSLHNFSSGVGLAATLHLMSAVPETRLLEFDPTGTAVYEELFLEPPVVEHGNVSVPMTPGLGVRLTDEIIEKYRGDR